MVARFEKRNVNPWFDLVRTQFSSACEELRRLASEDSAVKMGLEDQLRSIADKLDAAASHRLVMGSDSWGILAGHVDSAVNEAARLKTEHIDAVSFSAETKQNIDDLIQRSARALSDLDNRAEGMASDGRVEELQKEASHIGHQLLTISHYRIPEQGDEFTDQLREIGGSLHLIETERLYMDGGRSMKRIVECVHDLSSKLQAMLSAVQP